MSTLLAVHHRRAAHDRHQCGLCFRPIAKGELYEDQRCANDGRAFAFRSHLSCVSAYHSWSPDYDEYWLLADLTSGHLPPCLLAWASDLPHPCSCEAQP